MSGSCCSACDWLCGNDERTVFATPGAYQPLLPGHRDTKAVYAAGKQQQRGEFGRQGSADQDTRQQVYFIGLFLIGGIASTFANNLEAVYIGHIRTCADSVALRCLHANCSAAAPYTPANATNVSCPVLVHELQLPCEGRLPQWALLPPESDAASGEVSGHGLLADACPLSCAQCKSSFANRDAPAQLAAYSLVESFLGWFGGLGGLWGGLTPMVGRCVGRGDEEGAGRLLKMSFACCLFSTAVAWTIVYPFGGLIVQGAFAPQQDVYHYAIPFMHVHAAGMFFQYLSVPHSYCDIIIQNLNEYVTASSAYIQSVCEAAIAGLQYVTVGTLIGLLRSLYMGVSNYFTIIVWDGFGISGVFGEGCASSSRHCVVLTTAAAFLFCFPPNRRLNICGAKLEVGRDWKPFLRNGFYLAANSYLASLSQFINPILTSRMSGTAGTTALGARTIVGMVSSYPSLVGSVISQVVIVLGSKYTGRATRQAVDTYGTFVFRLAIISVVFAFCLAAAFFFAAETIFAFYSKDPAIVKECKSVTPLVVASIALSVGSSVVGGVVFAAQEFGFLTVINIATQFLVYLPAIIVVENKHFGEITLFRLMLPNFLQALVVTVFQVILIVTKVRPELARLAAQDAGVARTEQGVEMGQTVVLTSAGVVT